MTPDNILYNKEEDRFFCLLDAPSKDAVIKHHEKYGFKCDWITEVKTTAEVLHSGHGNMTLLVKEKVYLLHLILYLSIKGKENRMDFFGIIYRYQIIHFY